MRIRDWFSSGRSCLVAGLLLVVGACSGGGRGPGGPAVVGPLMLEPPPIYALLGYRNDLALTSEQVTALDALAVSAREELAPLIRELEERTGGRQVGVLRLNGQNQEIVEAVRSSQVRTSEAVAEVLTEDQRDTVCRLFQPRRQTSRQASTRPPPPMPVDSAGNAGRPNLMTTWSWCGQAPTGEAQA